VTPRFVSVADAAGFLGIPLSTAYRLLQRGEFPVPAVRVGRVWRVAVHQLEKLERGEEA
jgi:excisionase family DNA binding protein